MYVFEKFGLSSGWAKVRRIRILHYVTRYVTAVYKAKLCRKALRAKRTVEQQYEESVSRINELTTINVNLATSKAKIEQELATLAGDYEEVTKELRVSDERYQRVQTELKHTVEILHEEQERIVKIEAIKKSLEIEVKNLSVRLEEVEANAIVGGKRIISKLEARVRRSTELLILQNNTHMLYPEFINWKRNSFKCSLV